MCIDKHLVMFDNVVRNFWKGLTTLAAMSRHNITLEPEVYEEFCKYAAKKGIKVSTWINQQMKNFIEEEQMIEEMRKKRGI